MEKKLETTIGFSVYGGKEGMEKKMDTTIMGYIGTTLRFHSFLDPRS